MSKVVTIAEAKKQLSSCIREAEHGETIVLTRRGKAVAAIVSTEELEQLKRLKATPAKEGLASLLGGWEGSDELVENILSHKRSPERAIPDLD